MPHINLLYPFVPSSEFDGKEEEFSKKCENFTSFKLTFKFFNYFKQSHQRYTIWLKPEPTLTIKNLQSRLLEIVPKCNDVIKHKSGYTPHLSVGQVEGKNNLEKIINNLQASWKGLIFDVKEIYFISRKNSKESMFKIEKKILLEEL